MKRAHNRCEYLDTVARSTLDFDKARVCSATLADTNVYACCVCGKFFRGRGKSTPAYAHAIDEDHHVFVNLETTALYCLPDLYEVQESSLDDIKRCLRPRYAAADVAKLDTSSALSRDLQGVNYLPGFVGLNNLGHTDHINAVVQALAHVRPVRDFFLQSVGAGLGLTQRLGELVRKVWSAHNFKSSVSPHEFSQVACHSSAGRFRIGDRGDCGRFLFFVLNSLRQDGKCPAARDCVEAAFQGLVEVSSSLETSDGHAAAEAGGTVARSKFLSLSLEVPPVPLFKDSEDHNAVPQVPILELLKKFDGTTVTHAVERGEHKRRRYRLLELPKYLILHLARADGNPTVVTFPLQDLEVGDGANTKTYHLVANIAAGQGEGTHCVHTLHKSSDQWYSLHDLHVAEIIPQLVSVSTSSVLFYERSA